MSEAIAPVSSSSAAAANFPASPSQVSLLFNQTATLAAANPQDNGNPANTIAADDAFLLAESLLALSNPVLNLLNGDNSNTPLSASGLDSTLNIALDNTSFINALTPEQIQQASAILSPIASQPLNAELLQQAQLQLQSTLGVSSPIFTLNNIFMLMSAIAALQVPPNPKAAASNTDNLASNDAVSAVSASNDATAEDHMVFY